MFLTCLISSIVFSDALTLETEANSFTIYVVA